MAITAIEMSAYALRWASRRGVKIHTGCEQMLAQIFAAAEQSVASRLKTIPLTVPPDTSAEVQISDQVDAQLDLLLQTILEASPIGELHEGATQAALMKLCPGFWPIC